MRTAAFVNADGASQILQFSILLLCYFLITKFENPALAVHLTDTCRRYDIAIPNETGGSSP